MKKLIVFLALSTFFTCAITSVSNAQQNEQKKVRLNRSARFFIHMKALENQTKIKINIDKDSLRKHGISINEQIEMDYREYTFEEALDILTTKLSHTNPNKVFWVNTVSGEVLIFGEP